jgi:hypothetical protein
VPKCFHFFISICATGTFRQPHQQRPGRGGRKIIHHLKVLRLGEREDHLIFFVPFILQGCYRNRHRHNLDGICRRLSFRKPGHKRPRPGIIRSTFAARLKRFRVRINPMHTTRMIGDQPSLDVPGNPPGKPSEQ